MDGLLSNIRPSVRALSAYTLKRREVAIKLNQNESPWELPAALKAEVLARVGAMPWNRYPDFHPEDVLEGIGALHGVGPEAVLLGNGSNELLQAIFQAIGGAGVKVALPSPTFTLYAAMVQANDAAVVTVPLRADTLGYDAAALRAVAEKGEAHLLICNPNNPTGAAVPASLIAELLAATPRLVIVDEAYIQFAQEGIACDHLLATHPNLIVLRTLSKAAGLAGVRLGYAVGHPSIMAEISKIKLPYNVGHFGLEVARALLRAEEGIAARAGALVAERGRVEAALARAGVGFVAGEANFVLLRGVEVGAVFERLLGAGVLVRDVSHYPLLGGCLRVTVGSEEENEVFLRALGVASGGQGEAPPGPLFMGGVG